MKKCIICGALITSVVLSHYPKCDKCVEERLNVPHTAESNTIPENGGNLDAFITVTGASGSTTYTILTDKNV